jgi:hypothetical protein
VRSFDRAQHLGCAVSDGRDANGKAVGGLNLTSRLKKVKLRRDAAGGFADTLVACAALCCCYAALQWALIGAFPRCGSLLQGSRLAGGLGWLLAPRVSQGLWRMLQWTLCAWFQIATGAARAAEGEFSSVPSEFLCMYITRIHIQIAWMRPFCHQFDILPHNLVISNHCVGYRSIHIPASLQGDSYTSRLEAMVQ